MTFIRRLSTTGLAAAIGIALAAAARRRWTRALALLWGPTVCLSVVATGNHYVFDIAAGLLVTAVGFLARPAAQRLAAARRRSRPVLLQPARA